MAKGREDREENRDDGDGSDPAAPASSGTQRIDKWLWFARIVKSRTLAAGLVEGGKVRLNRQRIEKPSQLVKVGDVLTISLHRDVRVLEVVGFGIRRGPAPEARVLYADLTPPPTPSSDAAAATASRHPNRAPGEGRPTKRERRLLDRVREGRNEERD